MRASLLPIFCLFSFAACNQQDAGQEKPIAMDQPKYDPNTWVKADLLCEELRNADDDDPLAVVYLSLLDVQHVLDTVYTCSVIAPQMYPSYGIPHDALSACGGWWAGRGRFFYTLQQGDSLAVMHAHPVQADTLAFNYSLLRRFSATNTTTDLPEADYTP